MKCLIHASIFVTFAWLSTAWAQSGKPTKIEDLAAYNKPDREQVLYAGAKAEGKITWYTTLAGGAYKELDSAFGAKYPGVKVEAYRGRRQELGARILTETQAKRYILDMLESTIPLVKLLRDQKLITPYYFPTQAKFPEAVKEKGPKGLFYWSIDREYYIGLGHKQHSLPEQL